MNILHKRRRDQLLSLVALVLILLQGAPAFAQALPTADTIIAPEPGATAIVEPTADTTKPEFISITALSAQPTTFLVAWTTDELAYGTIEYGLTSAYGLVTAQTAITSLEQAQTLTGLTDGTTYHYRIIATDSAGNISYSADHSATTAQAPTPIDSEPPVIAEIAVSGVSTGAATFTVPTDEPSTVRIEYGTTEQYGSVAGSGEEFSVNHSIILTGLTADTTYYYRVIAEDVAGNINTSLGNEFLTAPLPVVEEEVVPIVKPLAIIDPFVSDITTSTVKIVWQTNKASDGVLWYGAATSDTAAASLASGSTSHSVIVKNLQPGTNYSYRIVATTPTGETATAADLEFNALAAAVVSAPELVISDIETAIGESSATITWKTNILSDSTVAYGTSTAYGSIALSAALTTSHSKTITGLAANTQYHFQITSADEAGNTALTEDYVFKTTATVAPEVTAPAVPELPDISTEEDIIEAITPAAEEEELAASVIVVPTPASLVPPPSPTRSGGAPPPTPLKHLALVHAEALDGQAIFIVDRPSAHNDARIRIVRNGHWTPKNSHDGTTIYQGPLTSFTDTKLVNGHTYHYAIYGVDSYRGVSAPVLIEITPQAGKNQAFLKATPEALQRAPHYVLASDSAVGTTGREVRHIQLLLAQNPAVYPEQLITGYFGGLTQKAITRFQVKHGLPITGSADAVTRTKLQAISKTRQIVQKSSFYRNLNIGSEGADVLSLQIFLGTQGYYPRGLFTGYFGPLTKQALTRFQAAASIRPVSGYFDTATRTRVEQITTQKETR